MCTTSNITTNSYFKADIYETEESQEMHHLLAQNLLVLVAVISASGPRFLAYLF